MAVNLPELGSLLPVRGVRLGVGQAAIKRPGRDDLVVLLLDAGSTAGAVFTRSAFRAAPVQIAEAVTGRGGVRALVINSGNANAATGDPGLEDAQRICAAVGSAAKIDAAAVMPFSTGVIGQRLPVERMAAAVPAAVAAAESSGVAWERAARAIMTTDTAPKALSRQVELDGTTVTITGMAKGAGMIKPDMATMLAYVCTDACVDAACLRALTREVADASFNRITIDGDTSTNDSFVVIATGRAGHAPIRSADDAAYPVLARALTEVAQELAQRIVRDGEGATKFVTVRVSGGASESECLSVAYTVAESPLVKTAVFAGDPNWGRFCMAIGRAGLDALDTAGVSLRLDEVQVARGGMIAPEYREEDGAAVMARDEFEVHIELGRGDAEAVVWTSDLSYEYVRINAEYRT
ncbi:MAG: bifunctional glutamate N-acetyltransferase/amino-acid acetyltransferase ArgJ [Pseudomonadales bacterium]